MTALSAVCLSGFSSATARECEQKVLSPLPLYSQIGCRVARYLPREHLTRQVFDDAVSAMAWTNYLQALDYERMYFLQSDIERFAAHRLQLDDELPEGEMQFAFNAFETLKERVRDRCRFVEKLLNKGFDLDVDESFHWKRKDRPWAADEEEWDDLWRKKVKDEYIRRTLTLELAERNAEDAEQAEEAAGQDPEEEDAPDAAEEADAAPAEEALSTEDFVRRRYEQFLTVLEDSDSEWVLQRYLDSVAQAFDPHSGYLSRSAAEDFDIEMRLSLVGIGALLRAEDGAAKIVRLIPGGPADRDKRDISLQPGDKIIGVGQGDGEPVDVLHLPLSRVVRLIRGEKGTTVVLRVIPASDPTGATTRDVDLVRDEVRLEEQAAQSQIKQVTGADGVTRTFGVITLPAFYANMRVSSEDAPGFRSAAHDVEELLTEMKAQNIEGLILDLRNNGGGSLLEAIRLTGLFIPRGPVVQVKERRNLRVLRDRDPRMIFDGPIFVLVNRLSASASEILSGALQDYGRAVIIGDSKTHGKGTVQTILELGEDPRLGSVKITTASYYRVSGSSTQQKGVIPDIVIPSPYDQMELGEDGLPNAIPWTRVEATAYERSDALAAALPELVRKSQARRELDSRFRAYRELLERVQAMNDAEMLSLRLEDRRKLAQSEKELSELQSRLAPQEDADEESDGKRPDLVMDESLRIMADLIVEQNGGEAVLADGEETEKTGVAQMLQWVKDRL